MTVEINVKLKVEAPDGYQGSEEELRDVAMESLLAKEEDMKRFKLDTSLGELDVIQVID